jgi:NitT/TauT family transport system permease protein
MPHPPEPTALLPRGEYIEYEQPAPEAADLRPEPRHGAGRILAAGRGHLPALVFVAILAGLLALWQISVSAGWIDELVLSTPRKVWAALIDYLGSPEVVDDLRTSGIELGAGYLLTVVVGVTLGLLAGTSRIVDVVLSPLVNMLNAVPRIALIPIFIIVFGIGVESKIATVFAVALIPVIISAQAGVRSVPADLMTVAVAFDANPIQKFTKVLLPGAVPQIIGGLRIGLGQALVGVIVGEFFAASAGIGHFMIQSSNQLQTDYVLAGTVIVTAIGWALANLMSAAERFFHRRHGGI